MLAMRQEGTGKAALGCETRGGETSANVKAGGGRDIDTVNFSQGSPGSTGTVSGNSSMKRSPRDASVLTDTAILVARIDVEIDWLKAQKNQLKKMRKQLAQMKVQNEKWEAEAQSAKVLLADMSDIQPPCGSWVGFGKTI